MSCTPVQNNDACLAMGGIVQFDDNLGLFMCSTYSADFPLEEACEQLDFLVSSGEVQDPQPQITQDPVNWTFENVNEVVEGVGGIVNNILGIFGLGSSPASANYSDPNALDQAQSRQQMNLILGFVAVIGLIMAGGYYSRKK